MKATFTLKFSNKIHENAGAFVLACLLLFVLNLSATNYYSKGSLDPTLLSNWSDNRDGSGASPASFTVFNDSLIIQNGHSMITAQTWAVGATGGYGLRIENGGTLQANHDVTVTTNTKFQIDNGGTYIHNFTGTASTTIMNGLEIFADNSTVEYRVIPSPWGFPTGGYGNVKMNCAGIAGNIGINGNIADIRGNYIFSNTNTTIAKYTLNGNATTTLTVKKNLIIDNEYALVIGSNGTGTLTFNVEGDIDIKNGELRLWNFGVGGNTQLYVSGNLNVAALPTAKFTCNNSTVKSSIFFNGIGKTYTKGAVYSNPNFNVIISSGDLTVASGTVLYSCNSLTVNSGATLKLNGSINSTTDVIVNGVLDCGVTSKVDGTGNFTLNTGGVLRHANVHGLDSVITVTGTKTINGTVVAYTSLKETVNYNVKTYAKYNQLIVEGISAGDLVTVYNVAGQQVKKMISSDQQTEIAVSKGVYIVKAITTKGISISKVLVE